MNVSIMLNYIITFILSLYGDSTLPRNIVDKIIRFIKQFIQNVLLESLENDIINLIKQNKCETETIVKVKQYFEEHGSIFDSFLTESSRFNLLQKRGFCMPQEIPVTSNWAETLVGNESVFVEKLLYMYQIPLRHSLKMFLEIQGLYFKIENYVQKLTDERSIVSNVIQGKFWLKKIAHGFTKERLYPLYLYYDEIETGNALGSHAGVNKFGMVYVSIACLPPDIASRLNSILFSTIIRAQDIHEFSNKKIFDHLIKELQFLYETGIFINVNNSQILIKFQLVLVLGDNLGLNSICGFVESFVSTIYCRICKATKDECSQLCIEDKSKLRTKENYNEDLKVANVQTTGIKEECVFNLIPNFHIAENRTVDLMHDIFEGVGGYVLRVVLYHLIFTEGFFTLETLNMRIQNFPYTYEDSNRPPVINKNRLKQKLNIKFSASEMICIIRYLGVMIGDLIPKGNREWNVFILMRKIVDVLISPRIDNYYVNKLRMLVTDFNTQYKNVFGELKPKFHFLTHYATVIENFGPCINFQSMRYESRHREIKANFQATSSNINPLKTIAIKQVLKLCYTIDTMQHESGIVLNSSKKSDDGDDCKSVTVNGIVYRIGSFLVTDLKESETEFGTIVSIKKLIVVIDKTNKKKGIETKSNKALEEKIQLSLEIYEEIIHDDHTYSYIVERNESKDKKVFVTSLPILPLATYIEKNGVHFIIPRFIL